MEDTIRAGGGIIWRKSRNSASKNPIDDIEIILIHRPNYDDWSFPKGKANKNESFEDCAVREVLEETGLKCEIQFDLSSVNYTDRNGRPKIVKYYAMVESNETSTDFPEPLPVAFGEVDIVSWMPVAKVENMLTYERDLSVLNSFILFLQNSKT